MECKVMGVSPSQFSAPVPDMCEEGGLLKKYLWREERWEVEVLLWKNHHEMKERCVEKELLLKKHL